MHNTVLKVGHNTVGHIDAFIHVPEKMQQSSLPHLPIMCLSFFFSCLGLVICERGLLAVLIDGCIVVPVCLSRGTHGKSSAVLYLLHCASSSGGCVLQQWPVRCAH